MSNGINQKIAKLLIKKQCSCTLPYTFLSSAHADFFSKSTILESDFRVPNISGSKLHVCKDFFKINSRVSNGLGPDQARHFVGPDLDAICLQRLSVENS